MTVQFQPESRSEVQQEQTCCERQTVHITSKGNFPEAQRKKKISEILGDNKKD